jgi:hypothetical protein
VEGEIDFGFGMLNFGLGWMGEKVGRGGGVNEDGQFGYLILLAEIVGLGSGISDQSIAGVNDFLARVAAGDSKFAPSDPVSLDRLSFLHPRLLSGRDQRFGGKDGEGVDHTPPDILVGGGGYFLCLDGEFGVLPDFAPSVSSTS